MASGEWEVVGKGKKNKQNGQVGSSLSKSERKKFAESAPKVEDVLPLSQVQTLYNVFDINKENKENRKPAEKSPKAKENSNAKNNQKKQEEKKKDVKAKTPKSLEAAIDMLDVKELSARYQSMQLQFRENPLIWMKDLSMYLNLKLSVEHTDMIFSSKPNNYPLCLLSDEAKHILLNAVNDSADVMQTFYEYCLLAMAQELTKGNSALGYKLILQLIAHKYPKFSISNIPKYISLRNSYQNRQPIGLSICWALGQGGVKDLSVGLKVWLEVMVPILEIKSYTRYIVQYLKDLFEYHSATTSKGVSLSNEELLAIMDKFFSPTLNIPSNLQKEFLEVYPKIKTLILNSPPAKTQQLFQSFLVKLKTTEAKNLKQEVVSIQAAYLSHDQNCFSVWRQLYTKNLPQSALLLKYINANWASLCKTLPLKLLKETLVTFRVTNIELVKGRGKQEGLQECNRLCEELLKKMTVSSAFPWKFGSFLLLLAISALLTYDIRKHGSFTDSSSGRFLRDVGALEYGEHAWSRIKIYSHESYRWAEKNLPYYYNIVSEKSKPYLEIALDKLAIVSSYLWNAYEVIQDYAAEKIPIARHYIEKYAPGVMETVKTYSIVAWEYLNAFAVALLTFVHDWSYKSILWLKANVFSGQLLPENLQRFIIGAYNTTHIYAVRTYEWLWEKAPVSLKVE